SARAPCELASLTDYPPPHAAARMGEARMAAFCRRHSYRGTKTPAQLLARLRTAPTAPVGLPAATLASMIGVQIALLRALQSGIAQIEALITERVTSHPKAQLLTQLPGVGTINLAQLLAELGPIL